MPGKPATAATKTGRIFFRPGADGHDLTDAIEKGWKQAGALSPSDWIRGLVHADLVQRKALPRGYAPSQGERSRPRSTRPDLVIFRCDMVMQEAARSVADDMDRSLSWYARSVVIKALQAMKLLPATFKAGLGGSD